MLMDEPWIWKLHPGDLIIHSYNAHINLFFIKNKNEAFFELNFLKTDKGNWICTFAVKSSFASAANFRNLQEYGDSVVRKKCK